MSRFRWFDADWPVSIRVLAKRIKKQTFDEDSDHGFVIDRVRDEYLEARYIERFEYLEKITDPFGKELTFNRIDFRQCSFRASSDSPGLELLDSPRGIQNLLSRLSEASDFALTIKPFELDVMAWSSEFKKIIGIGYQIKSLQLGSLQLDDGVTAKLVAKGRKDVQDACAKLTGKRTYTLEKIELDHPDSKIGSIVLSHHGSANISGNNSHGDILVALRSSLGKISKK